MTADILLIFVCCLYVLFLIYFTPIAMVRDPELYMSTDRLIS